MAKIVTFAATHHFADKEIQTREVKWLAKGHWSLAKQGPASPSLQFNEWMIDCSWQVCNSKEYAV